MADGSLSQADADALLVMEKFELPTSAWRFPTSVAESKSPCSRAIAASLFRSTLTESAFLLKRATKRALVNAWCWQDWTSLHLIAIRTAPKSACRIYTSTVKVSATNGPSPCPMIC